MNHALVKSQASGCQEDRFKTWLLGVMKTSVVEEAENLTKLLPNEILLKVFRYLGLKDLLRAEQVCKRWKSVVKTCFATRKTLDLRYIPECDALNLMRRCGPAMQTLFVAKRSNFDSQIGWIEEIAETFPNLINLNLDAITMSDTGLKALSTRCCRVTSVTLYKCIFTDEGLGLLLGALPDLKYLKIALNKTNLGNCFSKLGLNLEHLDLAVDVEISEVGSTHILSRCRNLKTLKVGHNFRCSDKYSFSRFCQECVSLRRLKIEYSTISSEILMLIYRCSYLEELELTDCSNVDSEVLIRISQGCTNLKHVKLHWLPLVSDRGVKALASCRNLIHLDSYRIDRMTDESLFELANLESLRYLEIIGSPQISDKGLTAVLSQCHQLEKLYVCGCRGAGDGTIKAAVEAVKNRPGNGLALHLRIGDVRLNPVRYYRHPLLYLEPHY